MQHVKLVLQTKDITVFVPLDSRELTARQVKYEARGLVREKYEIYP